MTLQKQNPWKIFSMALLVVIALGLLIPVDAAPQPKEKEATEVDCENPCIDETELTFDVATQDELDATNSEASLLDGTVAGLILDLVAEEAARKAADDLLQYKIDSIGPHTSYTWGKNLIQIDSEVSTVDFATFNQITIDNEIPEIPPFVINSQNNKVIANLHSETAQTADIAKDVVDHSITTQKYGWKSINGWAINDEVILGSHIYDSTISSSDIKDETITNTDIENGTIFGEDLADRTIPGNKIQTGTITADEIAAGTLDLYISEFSGTTSIVPGEFNTKNLTCPTGQKVVNYYVGFETGDDARISNIQRSVDGSVLLTFQPLTNLGGFAEIWWSCISISS